MLCLVPAAGGLFGIQHWRQKRVSTHCLSTLAVCVQKAAAVLNTPANLAAFHTAQVSSFCFTLRIRSMIQEICAHSLTKPEPIQLNCAAVVIGWNAAKSHQNPFV